MGVSTQSTWGVRKQTLIMKYLTVAMVLGATVTARPDGPGVDIITMEIMELTMEHIMEHTMLIIMEQLIMQHMESIMHL